MELKSKITTDRLFITSARQSDISRIIEMEEDPENRNFIWVGTHEEHMSEIQDNEHLLLVFRRKEDNKIVGYSLSRINFKSDVFELRRIVIAEKRKGYGREALQAHIKYAFEQMGMNRFWLDAYIDNPKGIALYESIPMHRDGVLRQSDKTENRGYMDQIIFSVLKSEYFERLV